MGAYSISNLFGLFIQTIFIQNILLFYFLGMCSYLACSNRLETAKGLGMAVTVVMTVSGVLNWFVHHFITKPGALSWLGFDASHINLSFLELLIFISVIAAFVQILEMIIDKYSPALYSSLGVYLPLITVNCAILGATLFATTREYPFIPNFIFVFGSGLGWWLAIVLIATLRDKMSYSNIPKNLQGMAITFIVTGLMALAFMGFAGITLGEPAPDEEPISTLIQSPS
jgi:Na+-transporting NADH:ubiquinone oxidoreductase subunit E